MSNDFEEPTFEQISDPDHPLYDKEWYLNAEIPHDDEWFPLVETLMDAKITARKLLLENEITPLEVIYQSQAQSKKAVDKVVVSGDELLWSINAAENYFQEKRIDANFVNIWGMLNKALVSLQIFYPELKLRRKKGQKGKAATTRELQKQWYALWWKNKGKMTRVELDQYLYGLCKAAVDQTIKPPKGWSEANFRNFVALMIPEGQKNSIAGTYGATNLGKETLTKLAEKGEHNPKLPPVGSAYYPDYNP